MNYEAKREKAIRLMIKARDKGEWCEVDTIHNTIVKADNVVDTRHANGILDRLLKSEFCMYLLEDKKNMHKTTVKEPHDCFSVELEELE